MYLIVFHNVTTVFFLGGFENVFLRIFVLKIQGYMPSAPFVFNQITLWISRDFFEWQVQKYKANAYVKSYTCWNHLLVMLWAQLSSCQSIRAIETSLRAHSDKTYRMGIGKSISRNNISHANATREVAIYRELAKEMMIRVSEVGIKDPLLKEIGEAFSISGFFAIDSTSITFDLGRFPWSVPQENKGGIKIHTMFDLLRQAPKMALITGHQERDQRFMEDYSYEENCLYLMDKAYCKTLGMRKIDDAKAYFIVPMKKNMVYEVQESFPTNSKIILKDEIIQFTSRWASRGYPKPLRRIAFYCPEKNTTFYLLTNNVEIEAATLAMLYKYRWEIEIFFKWIKQHLRITNFYGYSENAVVIQIYTAYIAYCILALAANNLKFKGSLYEFANIVATCLTEKTWLSDILKRYNGEEDVGISEQLPTLFDNL